MGLWVSPLFRPAPTLSSKWWEHVASGNTLIPGADISDTGEKLGRVSVDLGGRKDVASVGGKHYPMIVKDGFTRRAWMYFLRSKSAAGSAF